MKHTLTALALTLALPGAAMAAVQGELSTGQSQGEFDIFLTVTQAKNIEISGLQDLVFDYKIGDLLPSAETPVCVTTNEAFTYKLDIDAAPLTIDSVSTPYKIKFSEYSFNGPGKTGELNIGDQGGALELNGLQSNIQPNCNAGSESNTISVELTEAPANAGSAEAVITLTVTPE